MNKETDKEENNEKIIIVKDTITEDKEKIKPNNQTIINTEKIDTEKNNQDKVIENKKELIISNYSIIYFELLPLNKDEEISDRMVIHM